MELPMKSLFLALTLVMLSQSVFAVEVIDGKFANESEAGLSVAAGNTSAKNYNLKQANALKLGENVLKFDARFLNSFSNNVESSRYLFGALRYERALNEKFSLYVSQGFESDKFAGYHLRELSDFGGKYNILKEETIYWFAEAGYRYTKEEFNNGAHSYKNSLRAYTETEKKWTPSVSTKYFVEYVPNVKVGKDYQINTEFSVSAALTNIFSIKSAYLLRYDHMPAPTSTTKTDTLLTTALVAKF
jgi:putative salt-induced outer membrane protein